MSKNLASCTFLSMVLLLLFLLSGPLHGQSKIPASVIGNGGEKQTSTNYSVVGTVGQNGITLGTSTGYKVYPGFWNVYFHDPLVDVDDGISVPLVFRLEQNYPNPFNPSTIIKFAIPERSNVLIKIYDIIGSEIASLINEELDAGWHQRTFNAADYPSGVYFYRMEAGNYRSTNKMLLIK